MFSGRLQAKWETGAYLTLGDLWLCLSLDMVDLKQDYTHYAFSIDEREILEFKQKLKQMNVKEWKENSSEGDSIYFLDPDGHKHEVHYGNIETRLASCKLRPYKNMVFYE